MNILEKIVNHKINEVEYRKNFVKETELVQRLFFNKETLSLSDFLKQKQPGIIAEFKRKSPSVPDINMDANPISVTNAYEENGAAAISILTDSNFFHGSEKDLLDIRKNLSLPILRKDFIIDYYQILESKSIGSDAILLIAAILSKKELASLAKFAQELNLQVIMEVHGPQDLEKLTDDVDIIGVNNRNLESFKTDPQHSIDIKSNLPSDRLCISESGISKAETIKKLMEVGYDGFLIGEYFMQADNPGETLKELIDNVGL